MPEPRLSLNMIVRHAEATLGRCLSSAAGLVDEVVVVVDGADRDGSAELARSHGARVIEASWADSFAAARNVALEASHGDWVFWMDADEWLEPLARAALGRLVGRLGDDRSVYLMDQVSALGECGTGELRVAQARLFRRDPGIGWRYRVHEQILPACLRAGCEVHATGIRIEHSGYERLDLAREKDARNLRLLERDAADHPDDPWVLYQLGRLLAPTQFPEARDSLVRALVRTPPRDPLRRPIYALLVRGHHALESGAAAAAWLREGLGAFPNDTELLTLDGFLAFAEGDFARAEVAYLSLLDRPADADASFAAVDPSARGWQARSNLAAVYRAQRRTAEAEACWRRVVGERPTAADAWRGLAEIFLTEGRWDELDEAADRLEVLGDDAASTIRLHSHLARGAWDRAGELLERIAEDEPRNLAAQLLLARVGLERGDVEGSRRRLLEILSIEPTNEAARETLAALA